MSPHPFAFWKMHGTGNDFVLTESDDVGAPLSAPDAEGWAAIAVRVCDRHFGVGADGLIVAFPSTVADRRMRIFNPDGSEAEMCGNGIRCFVKYLLDRRVVAAPDGVVWVETLAGVLKAQATFDASRRVTSVRVAMGAPHLRPQDVGARIEQSEPAKDLPLTAAGEHLTLTLVSMGNPHAVHFLSEQGVDVPADFDLARIGPAVEHDPLFAHRTNFEVVRVHDRSHLEMRVWERGAAETLACGTGACAAVVAARLHDRVDDHVAVSLPGGVLDITWDGAGDVFLEGPAIRVYESVWEDTP